MKCLALVALLLVGCAGKKPCVICRQHVPATAHFSTRDCVDMPNGMYRCKNVVFDPHFVPVK